MEILKNILGWFSALNLQGKIIFGLGLVVVVLVLFFVLPRFCSSDVVDCSRKGACYEGPTQLKPVK